MDILVVVRCVNGSGSWQCPTAETKRWDLKAGTPAPQQAGTLLYAYIPTCVRGVEIKEYGRHREVTSLGGMLTLLLAGLPTDRSSGNRADISTALLLLWLLPP